MIRKSLFWGLTLILVVALVSLIIHSRQMEKQQAAQPAETVRQASISPTRVLAPQDLKIVNSTMQLKPDHTAVHEIEIQNRGGVPYSGILLKFTYQDRSGQFLLSKTYALDKVTILPARIFKAADIVITEVPAAARKFQVSIQYADIRPAGSAGVDGPGLAHRSWNPPGPR
jgi:hypothetical protein